MLRASFVSACDAAQNIDAAVAEAARSGMRV